MFGGSHSSPSDGCTIPSPQYGLDAILELLDELELELELDDELELELDDELELELEELVAPSPPS